MTERHDTPPGDWGLRLARRADTAMGMILAISLVAGAIGVLLGGSLSEVGSGAGGLWGFPALLTTVIALFVATPAALMLVITGRGRHGVLPAALVIFLGAWIIAIAYFVVAHAVDPCVNGWWDARSRIGGQPLCERYGFELNWHTRFHLLAHAVPAALLYVAYSRARRRTEHAIRTVPPS